VERRRVPLPTATGGLPVGPGAGLTDAEAAVRRAAFRAIRGGAAPDAAALAGTTGLDERTVEAAVASLTRKGQAVVDPAGRVVGSAGLSLAPARHRLRLGDRELHTWCAIDAVGIPAALGAHAVAATACPTCGRAIQVELRGGRARPDQALRAWLPRRDRCASVIDELCPDMNLFCTEEHLQEWRHQRGDPPGVALTLGQAEELGRQWWGDLA
jgi:hypothetical protein